MKKSCKSHAWTIRAIGEMCSILSGVGFPKSLQGRTSGDVPFFKVGDISKAWQEGKIFLRKADNYVSEDEAQHLVKNLLPRGSVVFAKIGAAISLNRRCILGQDSLVDNNVMGLCANPDVLREKFLFYFMCTISLGNWARASIVPSVRKSDVSSIPIPYADLNLQDRIVAKIEELFSDLDAGIAALERVQANLKRYRASVLKAAVEGRLTAEWRKEHPDVEPASELLQRILVERRKKWEESEWQKQIEKAQKKVAKQRLNVRRVSDLNPEDWQNIPESDYTPHLPTNDKRKAKYQEPDPPDATELPELPEAWCWVTMEQLSWSLRNGVSKKPSIDPPGFPILRINAVRPRSVNFEEIRFYNRPEAGAKDYFLEEGDLLFTRYNGSLDLLGVAGRVREYKKPLLHPDKLIRARFPFRNDLPAYLEIAANCGESRVHIVRRARTTAGQTGISGSDIKQMPIPLPPLPEQQQIVAEVDRRLSVADEIETQINTNLKRANRLRQAILKRAFEGKLVQNGDAHECQDQDCA